LVRYFKFGRIIRPPSKTAKDHKKSRRASPKRMAGYFQIWPDNPATLKKWLRTRKRRGARHPEAGGIFWPDYSRSGPDYPVAGLSGPNLSRIIRSWRLQWIHFGEGYLYPSPSSSPACSSSSRTRYYLEPTSLLDLHLQPTIVPDLWRIEGGGPDLHLHRRNFISLSISLGNLFLVVPWKH
jgi:hypothetical protein